MGNTTSAVQSQIKDLEYKWIPSRDQWLAMKPSERLNSLAETCWNPKIYSHTYSLDRLAVKRIFSTFPWPEGTTKEAKNTFEYTLSPDFYGNEIPLHYYRCNMERQLKYLMLLIGQEIMLLRQKEIAQETHTQVPQSAPTPAPPKKSFTENEVNCINTTGTPIHFPNGRVVDPIPHKLEIYKSEHDLFKTTDGAQFTGFNVDNKTLTQNYKILQQYNKAADTILVINENLAMWWVDIIEDVEWNGPIAYPVIEDGVCVKLACINLNVLNE